MVSPERQAAANRAESAFIAESFLSVSAALIGGYTGLSGFNTINLLGWPVFAAGLGLAKRAKLNKQRMEDMLNPTITDDDPRVAQLRRNYRQEIAAGAKAVKEFPSLVINRIRRAK